MVSNLGSNESNENPIYIRCHCGRIMTLEHIRFYKGPPGCPHRYRTNKDETIYENI